MEALRIDMKTRKKQYANTCIECNKEYQAVQQRYKFCSTVCAHKHNYNARMLDYKWRLSKLLAMAKNRAQEKSVPFNLTHEHLIELWDENLGCCAVTGRDFDLMQSTKHSVNINAPSLDRIIPSKGYTVGNVRLVVYILNCAMGEYGLDELRNLAKDLAY